MTQMSNSIADDKRFLLATLRDDASFSISSPLSLNTNIMSDTILSFAINHKNGQMKLVDEASVGGATPRQFSLNKNRDLVAVAMQNDGWVAVLERDVKSGRVRYSRSRVFPLLGLFLRIFQME